MLNIDLSVTNTFSSADKILNKPLLIVHQHIFSEINIFNFSQQSHQHFKVQVSKRKGGQVGVHCRDVQFANLVGSWARPENRPRCGSRETARVNLRGPGP